MIDLRRHCERSEAIHLAVRKRKNGLLRRQELLAMTENVKLSLTALVAGNTAPTRPWTLMVKGIAVAVPWHSPAVTRIQPSLMQYSSTLVSSRRP